MKTKFWDLNHPPSQPALLDSNVGATWTYGDLLQQADLLAEGIDNGPSEQDGRKKLIFILTENGAWHVAAYLAALRYRHCACLIPAELNSLLFKRLQEKFAPDWIIGGKAAVSLLDLSEYSLAEKASYGTLSCFYRRLNNEPPPIHPDVALLLSTSGSLGSPKMVRLSFDNLDSNAFAIAQYLGLSSEERPITTLPMSYSYGLSVINSHLHVGARLLLVSQGIITRSFWNFFHSAQATSLAGVPMTFEMLHRVAPEEVQLPNLRYVTQAGGALGTPALDALIHWTRIHGVILYVMYGQTEATARISYVPPERLADKRGSVGIAIPKGEVRICAERNEIVYRGPNVMMGYAENRADLALGDVLHGELRTGDTGYQDREGYIFLEGRLKRFVKIHGLRVNLDEIESLLREHLKTEIPCVGTDSRLYLFGLRNREVEKSARFLVATLAMPRACLVTRVLSDFPRRGNGKIDYNVLEQQK